MNLKELDERQKQELCECCAFVWELVCSCTTNKVAYTDDDVVTFVGTAVTAVMANYIDMNDMSDVEKYLSDGVEAENADGFTAIIRNIARFNDSFEVVSRMLSEQMGMKVRAEIEHKDDDKVAESLRDLFKGGLN